MPDPTGRRRPLTVDEYLRFEEASPLRHEYVAGEVHAMTGSTRRHNLVVGNLFARLRNAARGGPCRVYVEAVRLRAAEDVFYYPDVMVVCGPQDVGTAVADDPCLLIEVSSRSTAATDRREKLAAYRRIATLRAYLIVDQDRRRVTRHWRDESGAWGHTVVAERGTVPVPCPETELTLDEIYEDVPMPPLRVGEEWEGDEA